MPHDEPRTGSRRDFLTGKGAVDALAELVDQGLADTSPASGLRGRAAPAEPYVIRYGRRAMACEFEVVVNAGEHEQATTAALVALDLVDQLEAQLTVYRDTSEISRLNREAALGWMAVEPRLFRLLQQAARLHEETAGAYDITSGPLSKVWGFYRREGAIPTDEALAQARESVGMRHVEFDEAQRTLRFTRAGVELNLGSIGKGYALDRAAASMFAAGVDHFLWHGGQSSVLARGTHAAQPVDRPGWIVGLLDPLHPARRIAEIVLHDRAIGTSGAGSQFFRHGGKRYGHILDPRTGWPAEGVLSATAVAPTAAEADSLATAFYVMGVEATRAYCESRPQIGAVLTYQPSPGAPLACESINLRDEEFRRLDEIV
ncbi:MAG: FAD:protein FMN transferase [Pirellulales bacterium]|nr:FAD:protein FMN transferase [Pirellulales bacterium]